MRVLGVLVPLATFVCAFGLMESLGGASLPDLEEMAAPDELYDAELENYRATRLACPLENTNHTFQYVCLFRCLIRSYPRSSCNNGRCSCGR